MKPYFQDEHVTLYHGDCCEIMPQLDPVAGICTDPPYDLGFMGKKWDKLKDAQSWHRQWAEIALACCKPGAHFMAFGGTRTFHRLACAVEDAGWEIRDCLMWLHGQGFPKSLDVSKAIDKVAGAEREVIGTQTMMGTARRCVDGGSHGAARTNTAEPTSQAKLFDGYGSALAPAWEPIILAMAPLDGTFASNAIEHGVAGLNIDAGRIGNDVVITNVEPYGYQRSGKRWDKREREKIPHVGRWPKNVVLDEESAALLDEQTGEMKDGVAGLKSRAWGIGEGQIGSEQDGVGWKANNSEGYGGSGGASRFFYTAKASKADRGARPQVDSPLYGQLDAGLTNKHPTVKPIDLMVWLLKLLTPPTGGMILDPFAGSGSTLIAAKRLGIRIIGIEKSEEYCEIAADRCEHFMKAKVRSRKKQKSKSNGEQLERDFLYG